MYHIPNDVRARKSVELILQGLYKALEKKSLNDIKVNDIYLNCYVSRATFYRLFDSIYDVLLYQCDLIINEMLTSIAEIEFKDKKKQGYTALKYG